MRGVKLYVHSTAGHTRLPIDLEAGETTPCPPQYSALPMGEQLPLLAVHGMPRPHPPTPVEWYVWGNTPPPSPEWGYPNATSPPSPASPSPTDVLVPAKPHHASRKADWGTVVSLAAEYTTTGIAYITICCLWESLCVLVGGVILSSQEPYATHSDGIVDTGVLGTTVIAAACFTASWVFLKLEARYEIARGLVLQDVVQGVEIPGLELEELVWPLQRYGASVTEFAILIAVLGGGIFGSALGTWMSVGKGELVEGGINVVHALKCGAVGTGGVIVIIAIVFGLCSLYPWHVWCCLCCYNEQNRLGRVSH
ncbi:uncharacterized protein B0H18DRAFT_124854 [Fomitopsis serialis]|uniref:uncharacterized protein n=1 Tax=Fomitopsis serialis TaxID=139415 RepID=UPI002008926B|nr:uncharacterized protein B0H18DRAFT_124854 [Neoantrodia serialis]KAH9914596.1 hypothetical protein B0H18DRAFT_124854 [Neoantrodia serialis]